jgi:hypothetical protein
VAFRLIDDPQGPHVVFQGLVPTSLQIERNRPAECDTCDAELQGDALPFDLGIIAPKSAVIKAWLFEHQDPKRCADGQPGQFVGVIDTIERDRGTLRVKLKCRDLTAIPLGAKMSEEALKRFRLSDAASFEQLVAALVAEIPGTWNWRVRSLSAAASRPIVSPSPPVIKPRGGRQRPGAPGTRDNPIVLPDLVVSAPSRSISVLAPRATMSEGAMHLADIVGPHELTIWSAIANVCARAGIVPEVMVDASGDPVVVLVDGSDLQTSDVLRPFGPRNGRTWRVLVDGDGIERARETLTLHGGEQRPDFLQVDSYDPQTGAGLTARWPPAPPKREEDREETGVFQFVRGITSQEALLRMARAGWESLAHNAFRVTVSVPEPWSAGGGPEDPDLLDLGYGAAIELAMPFFERLSRVNGLQTPDAILRARGVDPRVVGRILAASERLGAMSLLFQVETVTHQWTGGSAPGYSCDISLRRFLGSEGMPIVRPADAKEGT